MLKVATYIASSTIPEAGMGLFAAVDIPAGTWITEEHPGLDKAWTVEEVDAFDATTQDMFRIWAYRDVRAGQQVWVLCADNARFANHADTPNVINHPHNDAVTMAARDIRAGEELLVDYRSFDQAWESKVGHARLAA